jgi:hypothetical protein
LGCMGDIRSTMHHSCGRDHHWRQNMLMSKGGRTRRIYQRSLDPPLWDTNVECYIHAAGHQVAKHKAAEQQKSEQKALP